MKVLYFAYGSNMASDRMRERIPSATIVGSGYVEHRHLVCNKLGRDGSGKANAVPKHGATTYGVIYEIETADLQRLDVFEGGYKRTSIEVQNEDVGPIQAEIYLAERLTHDPIPFEWYREIILAGAREHGLPEHYLRYLESLPARAE